MLVLDLDQTIVHTPDDAEAHLLGCDASRVFDLSKIDSSLPELLCAPRTHIMQFFTAIKDKFHVMYCTAGTLPYGRAVVQGLQDFMLSNAAPEHHTWIRHCTHHR